MKQKANVADDHHNKSSAVFLYNNMTILTLDSGKDANT